MTFDMANWLAFKRVLVEAADIDRDAFHIYAGIAIQLAAALLLRRRLGDWLPWLAVAGIALVNEGLDVYSDIWPDRALQAGKSLHDLVITMIVPTILMILARRWPAVLSRTGQP